MHLRASVERESERGGGRKCSALNSFAVILFYSMLFYSVQFYSVLLKILPFSFFFSLQSSCSAAVVCLLNGLDKRSPFLSFQLAEVVLWLFPPGPVLSTFSLSLSLRMCVCMCVLHKPSLLEYNTTQRNRKQRNIQAGWLAAFCCCWQLAGCIYSIIPFHPLSPFSHVKHPIKS